MSNQANLLDNDAAPPWTMFEVGMAAFKRKELLITRDDSRCAGFNTDGLNPIFTMLNVADADPRHATLCNKVIASI